MAWKQISDDQNLYRNEHVRFKCWDYVVRQWPDGEIDLAVSRNEGWQRVQVYRSRDLQTVMLHAADDVLHDLQVYVDQAKDKMSKYRSELIRS